MTVRRVGTSALSMFAGVSLVSAGVVSALLAGTHPTEFVHTTAATSTCGQHPATSVTNSAAIKTANAQLQADSASARLLTAGATASATSTPSPGGPIDTTSAAATSTPTPTASASSTPPPTDPATSTPTPSATPTSTPSTTPTPTPTPTTSSAAVLLCVSVQAVTTSGAVPAGTASYAIWIWPTGGAAKGIKVSASAKVSAAVTPKFSVCPTASGATCTVGTLAEGQADELLAKVAVPKTAKAGQHVTLTATAKGTSVTSATPASASVLIAAKAAATPSATPAPSGLAGIGATLPGIPPLTPVGVAASSLLPTLPAATDPGVLFPTVAPTATPSVAAGTLPNARGVRVTIASDSFPLGTRLVGGQVLGLAVLAAALVIAIARFSLREPHTQAKDDHRAP